MKLGSKIKRNILEIDLASYVLFLISEDDKMNYNKFKKVIFYEANSDFVHRITMQL